MTVYLLHFNQPINSTRPAQHYLGYTKDLDQRIRQHRLGTGSRLCQVAKERGIKFKLVEVWKGDRTLERLLKRQKNSPRFCPICQPQKQN
ncbi:MAG TPA: GIY-YIG nuclease family protein [Oculatellaceae cyanobacterium]